MRSAFVHRLLVLLFAGLLAASLANSAGQRQNSPAVIDHLENKAAAPTFYKDVLPILQDHCQSCHRPGEVAPLPLVTYEQTQPVARKIGAAVAMKMMPPWFADPRYGHFADDLSLTDQQIKILVTWAEENAPAGDPHDAPPPKKWASGWNIAEPDMIVTMPKPVALQASGEVEYTYEIVPTHFAEDRWVQMAELRPSAPAHVHHAVVYIRPPDSTWLKHAPVGAPFTASTLTDPEERKQAHETTSDLLMVYAPGSSADQWSDGMAKFVPAGSDLVFQMHYTTNGKADEDQTSIGLVFAKSAPKERVITLQLNNHALLIPPGADDFRVEVQGTLPNDATLLSLFPHMHLRGKRFEYDIVHEDGLIEPLLKVNYHFHWQLSYRLAEPRPLKAGTRLRAVAWYDNSRNNPHNPDPTKTVTWGDQTSDEMMVGFFDVAVPAAMDKWHYFIRHGQSSTEKARLNPKNSLPRTDSPEPSLAGISQKSNAAVIFRCPYSSWRHFMNAKKMALVGVALAATLTSSMAIAADTGTVGSGKIKHVVLLSIDGMHAVDFYNCAHGIAGANGGSPYCPNMAALGQTAINYVNASSSKPSDSFPGMAALASGGTPKSTGPLLRCSVRPLAGSSSGEDRHRLGGGTMHTVCDAARNHDRQRSRHRSR